SQPRWHTRATPSPGCRSYCYCPLRVARSSALPERRLQAPPPIPQRCICSQATCFDLLQFLISSPRTRRQRAQQEIVELWALHVGKAAGRKPQERLQNCHAQTSAVERLQNCHAQTSAVERRRRSPRSQRLLDNADL